MEITFKSANTFFHHLLSVQSIERATPKLNALTIPFLSPAIGREDLGLQWRVSLREKQCICKGLLSKDLQQREDKRHQKNIEKRNTVIFICKSYNAIVTRTHSLALLLWSRLFSICEVKVKAGAHGGSPYLVAN